MLQHFNNLHGGKTTGLTLNILKSKKTQFESRGTNINFTSAATEKPLLEVAYLCTKKKKSHMVAEELIKPRVLETAKIVLHPEAYKTIQKIPLSKHVIPSCIEYISENILPQIIENIKASHLNVCN